ncbi:MAG: Xaa-Pro peptidase family protein [Sedimentisphaerales bacterium]|jgi:Xaa-Pro aminopeptidase|nr:Xaa-Pro peptidase family protein [Sedimentisphaerales bacterium]
MKTNDRLKATRNFIRQKDIDWLVVVRPSDVTYLTGFLGQDSWAMVTDRQVYLLTDSRYTEQAQEECPGIKIVERMGTLANTLVHLVKRYGPRSVGVDQAVALADWLPINKACGKIVRPIEAPLGIIRSIKEELEIRYIRKAGLIARAALAAAIRQLRTGITELAFAGILESEIRKAGGNVAFDTIVAFGPNGSRPHHQPTSRRLKDDDSVLIDFGAKFAGYRCDITRTFAVGRPTPLFLKVFDVVKRAQAETIAAIRPGVSLDYIDSIPRQVIRDSGLPVYGHGSGHGIGLDIHEQPFLKPDAQGNLCVGQVLTVEPAVYLPGKLGVRLEDDVLVTPDGSRILTREGLHSYRPVAY